MGDPDTLVLQHRGFRHPCLNGDAVEGKMAKVFGVGRLGQVEKWAVLLVFWGKVAKMAKMDRHF